MQILNSLHSRIIIIVIVVLPSDLLIVVNHIEVSIQHIVTKCDPPISRAAYLLVNSSVLWHTRPELTLCVTLECHV